MMEEKVDERIEMARRMERSRKQLLDDLKNKRKYWKLIDEAVDLTV
jgi:hypothetical protein